MQEQELEIKNRLGFHARPAALFAKEAAKYRSSITVCKDGLEINGKSVLGLLMMAAESGSRLRVRAEGPDEKEALAAIARLFAEKFQED
ncbi:MAG TPA: HPr family phosphocarrier protein [Elusimicrobiota bacterium]|nr:HPr family phosphocarrier protein [Elusimicrobiota bacterium]